jgi:hypothetical protein
LRFVAGHGAISFTGCIAKVMPKEVFLQPQRLR